MYLMKHCFFLPKKIFFLFKVLRKVCKFSQILMSRHKSVLGLKIFVRVQTFRRRPFAASRIFCHSALKKAALVVGDHAEQVRNCKNFDITFWQFVHYFSHTIIFFSSAVPKSALGGPHIPDLS